MATETVCQLDPIFGVVDHRIDPLRSPIRHAPALVHAMVLSPCVSGTVTCVQVAIAPVGVFETRKLLAASISAQNVVFGHEIESTEFPVPR